MNRQELEQKVIECVSTTYDTPVEELSLSTYIKEDLSDASILLVGLVALLENELDVLVPLPTAAACNSLKELTDAVEELM